MSATKTYSFSVPSGGSYILNAVGNFFRIESCSNNLTVKADGVDLQGLNAGDGLRGVQFSRLQFTDEGGSANAVVVVVSSGEPLSAPITNTSIFSTVPNRPVGWAPVAATVTTAAATALSANSTRRYLLIQNRSATGRVYFRFNAAATVALGVLIMPGGFAEFDSAVPTGSLSLIGDIASNPDVLVVEA
ncbi:MAG: hypothetical protein J0L58_16825 [Burkholderiales bacterium]|nr:hypothetical protein [Burkholderiales bacterium]